MRLRTDSDLRQALYGVYCALFSAKSLSPDDFRVSRLTTSLTAVMGIEDCGWCVIGITPEALGLLESVEYRKEKLPRRLCRGHLIDRAQTSRALFDRLQPLPLDEFFELFLKNDRTVIMLAEQNRHNKGLPSYIPFENQNGELFPNGSLMAWKHRKRERDFLRGLSEVHFNQVAAKSAA